LDIVFSDERLERECNNRRLLVKRYGKKRADRIQRRIDNLRNAKILEDMRNVPGRCHELGYNRAGQLSLDLDHPYRLIFEPANDPIPKKPDGGLNWKQVSVVRILGIEDTHE